MPPLFSDFRSPFSTETVLVEEPGRGGWVAGGRGRGCPAVSGRGEGWRASAGREPRFLQEIRSERTIADCLHDRMEASLFTVKFGLLNHTKKGQVKKTLIFRLILGR